MRALAALCESSSESDEGLATDSSFFKAGQGEPTAARRRIRAAPVTRNPSGPRDKGRALERGKDPGFSLSFLLEGNQTEWAYFGKGSAGLGCPSIDRATNETKRQRTPL